jgi:Heparinase II/III-like protein
VLNGEEIVRRREIIAGSTDLASALERLARRTAPVLARLPEIPSSKALLTADGGVCPDDRVTLEFDPWSTSAHRCSRCGRTWSGERHDRAWARFQHLWLAERAADLATLAALQERTDALAAAERILSGYAERYLEFPNRDNVLGPSRLFFSTYLESIWLTSILAAATLLREAELLDPALADGLGSLADEAANLIGEFDEGFSNRQTWHNAALAAIAVWFQDEELAGRVVQGPTGVIAHLVRGFGQDGMWFEGENYHLFALRGQLLAMGWLPQAGIDLLADERLRERLAAALRAPALSALPDATFPARKDSRYGMSLAQPMYLELWEVGLARLGDLQSPLWSWLRQLYEIPPPQAERFDSYLHEAGAPKPEQRTRADLSWWALLEMEPGLPENPEPWAPGNVLLEGQGLAVLRREARYASLECGPYGGGHGHPDRLHLTLHAGGRHWLPDPGTGSYVARDLFWYRSTLAHNAPRLDGVSQVPGDASCTAFDQQGDWAWARGSFGPLSRTLVAGPGYLLDLLDLAAAEEHLLELPWHVNGSVELVTPGRWLPATLADDFAQGAERFEADSGEGQHLRAGNDGSALDLHLWTPGADLLRAWGPGLPSDPEPANFFLTRGKGRYLRLIAVLEPASESGALVKTVRAAGDVIEVETAAGTDRHAMVEEGWGVETGGRTVKLRGVRRPPPEERPLIDLARPTRARAGAPYIEPPPTLDGSLDGFDTREAITLDYEDQYRRSEEPYAGPEEFSALAAINWDQSALYLGIHVHKTEMVVRPAGAPSLKLDNEPEDIHADGVQVFLRPPGEREVYGFVIVPSAATGAIRARGVGGTAGSGAMVEGSWQRTEEGYVITAALTLPEWHPRSGDEIEFDLLVNQMEPDRLRRAGQLVWSGGGGWVYLRGDRQDPASFGILELR